MTHPDAFNWPLILSWGGLVVSLASLVLAATALSDSSQSAHESAQLVKDSTERIVHQVQLVLGAFEEAGFMDANRNERGEIIGYKVKLSGRTTVTFGGKTRLHVPDASLSTEDPD